MLDNFLYWLEEWAGPLFMLGIVILLCAIIWGAIAYGSGTGVVTYNKVNGEAVTVKGRIHRNGHNVTVIEKDGTTHVIYTPCQIKYDE